MVLKLVSPSIKALLMGLAGVSALVLILTAAGVLAGFPTLTNSISGMRQAHENLKAVLSVQQGLAQMQTELASYLRSGEEKPLQQYRASVKTTQTGLKNLEKLLSGKAEWERRVRQMEGDLVKWQEDFADPAIAARGKTPESGAQNKESQSNPRALQSELLGDLRNGILTLAESQIGVADSLLETMAGALSSTQLRAYVGVPACAAFLLLASFLLARYITRSLAAAMALADAVKRGELSDHGAATGFEEARELSSSINEMAQSLAEYNNQILKGVEVVTDSVSRIASTSSQLFISSSQTAAAVTETTATVNEMGKTAKVVNQTAKRVVDHSGAADEIASSGTKATGDTLQKMNLIKEKMEIVSTAVVGLSENAKYVEDIVGAVQDLADQSNLLAVNASIEAARAGEHGKGFAVVAHEIKSLADQSREATLQVTRILQEIRKSVGSVVMATEEGGKAVLSGVEQSETAGKAIEKLAENIAGFSQAAAVIFSSTEKQFARVESVAEAMRNVEQAMNNGVDGTTQLENEAKRLEQLALSLRGLVNQ